MTPSKTKLVPVDPPPIVVHCGKCGTAIRYVHSGEASPWTICRQCFVLGAHAIGLGARKAWDDIIMWRLRSSRHGVTRARSRRRESQKAGWASSQWCGSSGSGSVCTGWIEKRC
jgi:hypothetical protein